MSSLRVSPPSASQHVHRWLMPYADMLTVLFVVILALQSVKPTVPSPTSAQPTVKATEAHGQHTVKNPPILSPQSQHHLQHLKLAWQAQPGGGIKINLPGAVLFASNQATLSQQGEKLLRQLAPVLSQGRGKLRVEGHTDDTPTADAAHSNRVLSAERAASVTDFLTEQLGLDPRQLQAIGYGATQPIISNSTKEGKQRNRRVVIVMED
jgi:chemotaxis protein MotB